MADKNVSPQSRKFLAGMLLVLALAFLLISVLRVMEMVGDHRENDAGQAAPSSSGVRP